MIRVFSLLALLVALTPLHADVRSARSEARAMAEQGPLDPAVIEEAINKLHEIGIITDPQYWIENVRPGNFIPTAQLQPVLIAAANKYETVETVEAAIAVLHKNKIISNTEKWSSDVVYKPKAASGVVSLLFLALSKNIN